MKSISKAFRRKRFVIPSTRQACLFFADSCKIRLLRQIICFLPLRFLYKHTNKEMFWKSYSLSLREEQVLSVPQLHWIGQTASKHTMTTEKQKVGWMLHILSLSLFLVTNSHFVIVHVKSRNPKFSTHTECQCFPAEGQVFFKSLNKY